LCQAKRVRGTIMREGSSANPLYFVYLAVAVAALLVVYFWFSPAGEQGTAGGGTDRLAVLPPRGPAGCGSGLWPVTRVARMTRAPSAPTV
jgi:hypothetical protein